MNRHVPEIFTTAFVMSSTGLESTHSTGRHADGLQQLDELMVVLEAFCPQLPPASTGGPWSIVRL
jgi:hypothetical protein